MPNRVSVCGTIILFIGPLLPLAFGQESSGPSAPEPVWRSLAEFAPEDCLAYAQLDLLKIRKELPNLEIVRLVRDPQIRRYFAPIENLLNEAFETMKPSLPLEALDFDWGALSANSEVCLLGVTLDSNESSEPSFDFLFRCHTEDPARLLFNMVRALRNYVEVAPTSSSITNSSAKDDIHHVTFRTPNNVEVFWAVRGKEVLAAGNLDRLKLLLENFDSAANPSRSTPSLAQSGGFRTWQTRSVRSNAIATFFLNLSALWPMIHLKIDPDEGQTLANSGIDRLEYLGASAHFERGVIRESVALGLPKEKVGVLKLFDALVPDPNLIAKLPPGRNLVLAMSVDLKRLIDSQLNLIASQSEQLADEVAKFRENRASITAKAGFDAIDQLLATSGPYYAFAIKMPMRMDVPRMHLRVESRDTSGLVLAGSALAERLFAFLSESEPDADLSPVTISSKLDATHEIVTANLPFQLLAPTVLIADDSVYLTETVGTLRRWNPLESDRELEVERTTTLEAVKNVTGGDTSGLIHVFVLDVPDMLRGMLPMGIPMATSMVSMGMDLPRLTFDGALAPDPEDIAKRLSSACHAIRVDDQCLLFDGESPIGYFGTISLASGTLYQYYLAGIAPMIKNNKTRSREYFGSITKNVVNSETQIASESWHRELQIVVLEDRKLMERSVTVGVTDLLPRATYASMTWSDDWSLTEVGGISNLSRAAPLVRNLETGSTINLKLVNNGWIHCMSARVGELVVGPIPLTAKKSQ